MRNIDKLKCIKIGEAVRQKEIHALYCIVNNTFDEQYISRLVLCCMKNGCKIFAFCGRFAGEWHNQTDLVYVRNFFQSEDDDSIVTYEIDNVEELAFDILNMGGISANEDAITLLLYDDDEQLDEFMKIEKVEQL